MVEADDVIFQIHLIHRLCNRQISTEVSITPRSGYYSVLTCDPVFVKMYNQVSIEPRFCYSVLTGATFDGAFAKLHNQVSIKIQLSIKHVPLTAALQIYIIRSVSDIDLSIQDSPPSDSALSKL